ncbi:MAG TPA: hypothetical protein VIV57_23895 [Anaeromyxobacter sp.]
MRATPFLPLAALAAACAHAPAPAPRALGPADYFPLAVGSERVYRDESPALPPERRGGTRTIRILAQTRDGYYRDSERGELRVDGECLHDRARRLLCAPIAAGKSWASVVSVSSTERYEIASVGESIATPAGRFENCVKVRAHNRAAGTADLVNEITYAPGVGPVVIETFALVEGKVTLQFRALLQSYRVGGR